MFTEAIKAKAIAKIKHQVPIEDIAEELELPTTLIEQWAKLEGKDLVALESNLHAIENVTNQETLDPTTIDRLKDKLEKAAEEITDDIGMALGDPVYAKSLQLCADTVSKLYITLVQKSNPSDTPDGHVPLFETLMRD